MILRNTIKFYLEQFDFIVVAAGCQNILMGVPLHPFDVLKMKLIQLDNLTRI